MTTRTPMHSTKLPLWKWLLCMYFMVNSSKGVSSVFMGKWLGVAQRTAWKMGHAVRRLMEPSHEGRPPLNGIVELDEKYLGGKPRYEKGVTHKRGKGTEKQGVLVALERQGQVRSALIASDQAAELRPLVERFVDQQAHLMTDQNWAYQQIGKDYAAHSWVNHSAKEFARGDVHNNTAESFNSLLERAKQGIFHYTLVIPDIVKYEVVDAGKAKNCDDAFVVEKNISKNFITIVNHVSDYVKGDSALIDLFPKGNYDAVATDDAKLIRRLRTFEIPFILPGLIIFRFLKDGHITKDQGYSSFEPIG